MNIYLSLLIFLYIFPKKPIIIIYNILKNSFILKNKNIVNWLFCEYLFKKNPL